MKTLSALDPAIADFATAVRAALGDLAPDDVDDLTDGLEADLSEQAADGDHPLGDPVAYADELRSAAGLPPRGVEKEPGLVDALRRNLTTFRDDAGRVIRSNPFLLAVADLLTSMRPAWWAARGLLLFGLFSLDWLNNSGERIPEAIWFLAAAWVVLSVQWGRGRWLPKWGRRAIPIIASIVAVLVIVPLIAGLYRHSDNQMYRMMDDSVPTGLQLQGGEVSNIFAYGADGELLTDVQLFDQNGNPLNVVDPRFDSDVFETYTDDQSMLLVPRESTQGDSAWNVFPLLKRGSECYDSTLACARYPDEVTPPFLRVQPLIGAILPMSPTNTPGAPADEDQTANDDK